jgi:hypothetical protein
MAKLGMLLAGGQFCLGDGPDALSCPGERSHRENWDADTQDNVRATRDPQRLGTDASDPKDSHFNYASFPRAGHLRYPILGRLHFQLRRDTSTNRRGVCTQDNEDPGTEKGHHTSAYGQ